MQVDRVKATIRFSQDTGHGAWKSVELGAEATVAPTEDWREAQVRLYAELTTEFRNLWGRPNGNGHQREPQAEETAHRPEHWCEDHQTEFERHTKGKQVWHSHRIEGSREWCREKSETGRS